MVLGIDLGSNTLRACVMKREGRAYEIVREVERIVGSARGLKEGCALEEGAKFRIKTALGEILSEFRDIFWLNSNGEFNLAYQAVATEAFRLASDSDEFFAEIFAKFCIKFNIIDAERETKLTRLGIENRLEILQISAQNAVSIDLGGASTEISDGKFGKSFKFGIVKFCNENPEILSSFEYARFSEIARSITQNANEYLRQLNAEKIILTSGVPTTISALKMGLKAKDYNAEAINGSTLNLDDFRRGIEQILKFSVGEADEAIGENRAAVIIAGALLLEAILQDRDESENFVVVDDGLREGACIDLLQNLAK